MRRVWGLIPVLVVALLLSAPSIAIARSLYVQDDAGIIAADTERYLNELGHWLDTYSRQQGGKSGAQLAVVTVRDLGGETLEMASLRRARTMELGDEKADNGGLLFVAVKERKIRIEVGYGLEGVLPDSRCKRIIDEEIAPLLKAGDFDAGIQRGFERMVGLTAKEYGLEPGNRLLPQGYELAPAAAVDGEQLEYAMSSLYLMLIVLVFVVLIFAAVRRTGTVRHYGRGWGGGWYGGDGWGDGGGFGSFGGGSGGGGDFGGGGASGDF